MYIRGHRLLSALHRFILTHNRRHIATALLAARRVDVDQLARVAA